MNHVILLIEQYKYAILFPLAAIEGPVVSLAVGFLIYLGQLTFVPAYIILLFGDLIPDSIYYAIGRFGNRNNAVEKYSKKGGVLFRNFQIVEKLWQEHPKKTMFLSKLAYGLSTPFLVSAGLVKMPFKKFVSMTIPITLFQYAVLLTIGYSLGSSYLVAEKYVQDAGLIIAGILIVLIIGYIFLSRYAYRQMVEMEEKDNPNLTQ